jgi:hypothetical protein
VKFTIIIVKSPTELVKSPNEIVKSLTEIVKFPTDSTLNERHSSNLSMNGFGALNGQIEMESNPVYHRGYSVIGQLLPCFGSPPIVQ